MNNLSTNEPKTILDLIEKSELHLDSDTPKQYFDYMEDRVMNQIRSHQNSAQPSINKLPWYLTAAASISLIVLLGFTWKSNQENKEELANMTSEQLYEFLNKDQPKEIKTTSVIYTKADKLKPNAKEAVNDALDYLMDIEEELEKN